MDKWLLYNNKSTFLSLSSHLKYVLTVYLLHIPVSRLQAVRRDGLTERQSTLGAVSEPVQRVDSVGSVHGAQSQYPSTAS